LRIYYRGQPTTYFITLSLHDALPILDSHTIIRNGRKVVLGSGLDVSGDLQTIRRKYKDEIINNDAIIFLFNAYAFTADEKYRSRSEEHTSELQSRENLVCRLLLEKKK